MSKKAEKKNELATRMKTYEAVPKLFLTRRVPVIIRLDGKAFHTFTRKFKRPFDPVMMRSMQDTMKYLCENIQGCVFGYTQSDEISLVLTDYATISTEAWFGYNLEKMTSISAGMATIVFSKVFSEHLEAFGTDDMKIPTPGESPNVSEKEIEEQKEIYRRALTRLPVFDSRAFSIPKDEVCNCLIWRQKDATRNSIESVGQVFFSDKQLHKKSTDEVQEMLFSERGINWNDYPVACKRGSCCYKVMTFIPCENGTEIRYPTKDNPGGIERGVYRDKWVIDREPPIFTGDRLFVEKFL